MRAENSPLGIAEAILAERERDATPTACDHADYSFAKHGRYCLCGELMADFGD